MSSSPNVIKISDYVVFSADGAAVHQIPGVVYGPGVAGKNAAIPPLRRQLRSTLEVATQTSYTNPTLKERLAVAAV